MQTTLAQFYGFEHGIAVQIFMVGFAGVALLAALFIRLSLIQWILAGILFFNCLSPPANFERTQYLQTWMLPVQMQRANAHLVLGIILTLVVILTNRLHAGWVPIQGLFILAINLFAGLMMFIHETPKDAAQTLGFALAVVPCMLFACPAAARSHEACMKTVRAIMLASVVWTVCCSIQFVINPRLLVNSDRGRFWGMHSNAQGAALIVAPFAVVALWLMLNDRARRMKVLWIGLVGINLLFLGWTGSRTGLLTLVAGAVFVLYRRVGKVVIFLPVAAVVTVVLSALSDELQIANNLERLTSTENTREGVWNRQLQVIMESPLVGVGWKETGASESSYLAGWASYGALMMLLMTGFLLFSMWKCARVTLMRGRLPKEQRPLVDMFVAYNAMYFASSFFEGHIMARSIATQTMMFMFAGIGVWLTEAMARPADGAYEPDDGEDPGDVTEYDAMVAYDYSHPEKEAAVAAPLSARGAIPGAGA
ncbi:MAG: O-antigen ligase family protein [Phycisphaerales bacterium]|nr:O-antigen ligase family protein [Phycisphaerales bacterium]